MRKFPLKGVVILGSIILIILVTGVLMSTGRLGSGMTHAFGVPAAYLTGKVRSMGIWFQGIKRWDALVNENTRLKQEWADLVARTARLESLEQENEFLRSAARVDTESSSTLVYAGLFGGTLDAQGHHALINKGTREGIREGDVVIFGDGVLVGQIHETSPTTARVRLITDPAFEITAHVLGGRTTGIVHGNLARGLLFDLIAQEEQITEGDIIVSTGNDQFPSALVIGTVEHVATNTTELFKEVRIKPMMDIVSTNRVLVLTHTP